jgi:hypothetical protein
MVRGTTSKLIFIDSSVNTHGDHTKVIVPPHPFSATGAERLALSLVSFSMRRNWYNLNNTNRTFYLFLANAYYEVNIVAGVYSSFATLAAAIQTALGVTIAGVAQIATAAVAYSAVSRKFTISLTMAAGSEAVPVEIRCFAVKGGALPAGVTLQGAYSDSHEILGARPVRVVANAADSMVGELAAGVNTLISYYPASLNTLDAVYIHINTIETGNFMSTGHESHAQDSLRLIESSLFARVPFDDSSFTEAHEVIQFEDNGGDSYQSFLSRKSLDTLDIRVTDARGRSLATLDPTQADEGLMAFRMCLRWDLFSPPPAPTPRREIAFEKPPTV